MRRPVSTTNTIGVPGGVAAAIRPAVATRASSVRLTKGLALSHVNVAPRTMAMTRPTPTTAATVRLRRAIQSESFTSPSAARIGSTYANEKKRTAGTRPVATDAITPTISAIAQTPRNLPRKPSISVSPSPPSGTCASSTYRARCLVNRPRYSRWSSLFASASPAMVSLAASNCTFRPVRTTMFARWQ